MCAVWISHSSHENGISVVAITSAKSNLCLLIDVEMLLGLNVIMPLLEAVFFFIKFAQLRDVFMCDFIVVVKIYDGDVYRIYCDKQITN